MHPDLPGQLGGVNVPGGGMGILNQDLFRACGYAEDEVAMLGTFDTPWSRLLNFKLSSLNVRPMEMVQQVWDMYTGKIPVGQMKLQPELIFRDSTTAFRGGRNK